MVVGRILGMAGKALAKKFYRSSLVDKLKPIGAEKMATIRKAGQYHKNMRKAKNQLSRMEKKMSAIGKKLKKD